MQSCIDALQKELVELRQAQVIHTGQTPSRVPSVMISEEPTMSSILSINSSQQQSVSIDLNSAQPEMKGLHFYEEKDGSPKIKQDDIVCTTNTHAQENERLKAVISDMRMELERLQEMSSKLGSEDISQLMLELQESDNDLRQTMEHVEVLEKQIQENNADAFQNQELPYLREKVEVW